MGECGECTICCILCVVPEFNKKAGERCIKLNGDGCKIYGNHPQRCKDFECAYFQGGNDLELRPDKCRVMFFKKNDRIFVAAIMSDMKVTNKAKRQIRSFNEQGYSVVMLKVGEKPYIILADGHTSTEIYQEYVGLLNGDI